ARNVGAVAAIRLVPSGAGVEVWVTDRVTGKTIVRDLATPSGDAVALGAVELLRASFMELHADVPHRGEVAPTPQVKALALPEAPPPEPRRPSLAAGAGVGLSAAGPSADAQIAVAAPLWKGLGVRAFASLPLVPAQRHVPEGVVRLSSQLLALFVTYDWLA